MKKQEEKMKKVYLLLLSLVVLMIALTGCGKDTDSAKDNSKPITLRYSTMQNKDHISYQVALNIKQAVEEKTEGRVLIDIYPANQLGDWSQVYDELMMGSIDMAHSSVPETYDARTAVGYFPYLSSSHFLHIMRHHNFHQLFKGGGLRIPSQFILSFRRITP